MFDFKSLNQMPVYENTYVKTESLTSNDFCKKLRQKLSLSQRIFAKILGISEKTVEKWEQGANPIKGAASRLLYLLDLHPELINDLYSFKKGEKHYPQKNTGLEFTVADSTRLCGRSGFNVTSAGNPDLNGSDPDKQYLA